MSIEQVIESWETLEAVISEGFRQARLQAHWAAQIVGASGRAWIDPAPDDSHTSAAWLAEPRVLVGDTNRYGLRVGLCLADLSLVMLDSEETIQAELPLAGRTLEQAMLWAQEQTARVAGRSVAPLERPTYDMPEHGVAKDGAFDTIRARHYEQLASWYANASNLIEWAAAENPGASAVRCWPHHFDIATLIALDPDEPDAERARTIGCGLSPGDDSYSSPYFYVNPWPRPETDIPRRLEGEGSWHTTGWLGAVLPSPKLQRARTAQARQVCAFVSSAIKANRRLLSA